MGRLFDDANMGLVAPHLMHLLGGYPAFIKEIAAAIATTQAWRDISLREPATKLEDFARWFLATDSFLADTDVEAFLESFSFAPELRGAVVFKADNVAKFYVDHHENTNLSEFLPTYAPPFRKFWVEYDTGLDLPEIAGQRRVGVLFNGYDWRGSQDVVGDPEDWRWALEAFVYLGLDTLRVAGPYFVWRIFVRADGSSFKEVLELPRFPGVRATSPPHEEWWNDDLWSELYERLHVDAAKLLRPALLTLGFLHCKNVEQVENVPTPLTKKQRRRGLPSKSRFFTLEIDAIRKVLERDGGIESRGLGNALHICRGHFKTFTADAPLLGRATGTYWWSPQVRGKRERGVAEKDYEVFPPRPDEDADERFGVGWTPLSVEGDIDSTAFTRDGEAATRGLRAHHQTLELLREFLNARGIEPRRAKLSEPQFDMGFEYGDVICIVEAKSLTALNYEHQLRVGIGQLAGYRFHIRRSFPGREVRAFLLSEIEPPDKVWIDICSSEDIRLIWPKMFSDGDFLK